MLHQYTAIDKTNNQLQVASSQVKVQRDLPEFTEVPGRVRHHTVDDVLKDVRLGIELLDDSPLREILVPQVAAARKDVGEQTLHHTRDQIIIVII